MKDRKLADGIRVFSQWTNPSVAPPNHRLFKQTQLKWNFKSYYSSISIPMYNLLSPKSKFTQCLNTDKPTRIFGFDPSFEHSYVSPSAPLPSPSPCAYTYLSDEEDDSLSDSVCSSTSKSITFKRVLSDPTLKDTYMKASRNEMKLIETQINMENAQRESLVLRRRPFKKSLSIN
ncbi:hypothetical protein BC833DRAFT_646296 [Globomyces pollinis-pini]|nr:hypothetical protein BC833DRAFT_646296 [Globomyces pollinis-pini]